MVVLLSLFSPFTQFLRVSTISQIHSIVQSADEEGDGILIVKSVWTRL